MNQENLQKFSKKSESVVFEPKPVHHPLPPTQFNKGETPPHNAAARATGSLFPGSQLDGFLQQRVGLERISHAAHSHLGQVPDECDQDRWAPLLQHEP